MRPRATANDTRNYGTIDDKFQAAFGDAVDTVEVKLHKARTQTFQGEVHEEARRHEMERMAERRWAGDAVGTDVSTVFVQQQPQQGQLRYDCPLHCIDSLLDAKHLA